MNKYAYVIQLYVELQNLRRASTPIACYDSVGFLNVQLHFYHVTDRCVNSKVRFLHGAVRFMKGAVRFLNGMVRLMNGTFRFFERYGFFNGTFRFLSDKVRFVNGTLTVRFLLGVD